jgi:hypothetical protein
MPKVLKMPSTGVPKGAVYIGRPGPWGNPFLIGRDGDRAEVVRKFRDSVTPELVLRVVKELKGKDLVCFCAPKACHGDVLLEIANPEMNHEQE